MYTILSSFTNFLFSPLSTNHLSIVNVIIFMENIFSIKTELQNSILDQLVFIRNRP